MVLRCPICGMELEREEKSWRCGSGHSFDIARQGYVNLLPVQFKHSRNPGDTRQQVLARRAFLESGSYLPIAQAVSGAARDCAAGGILMDVGCGEGYYAVRAAQTAGLRLIGLDISKEAVRCAAARYKQATWICATASHLPVADGSVDVLMSMFALTVPGEFARVLRSGGVFIQVLAARDHLLGLKSLIYPEVFDREKESSPELPGFIRLESREIRFEFSVQGEQVQNLLAMTPHFWRISADGALRLREKQSLTDRASCVMNIYRKA